MLSQVSVNLFTGWGRHLWCQVPSWSLVPCSFFGGRGVGVGRGIFVFHGRVFREDKVSMGRVSGGRVCWEGGGRVSSV